MYYEFNGLATKTANNSSKIINFIDRIKYSPNSILQEIKHFFKNQQYVNMFSKYYPSPFDEAANIVLYINIIMLFTFCQSQTQLLDFKLMRNQFQIKCI